MFIINKKDIKYGDIMSDFQQSLSSHQIESIFKPSLSYSLKSFHMTSIIFATLRVKSGRWKTTSYCHGRYSVTKLTIW